MVQSMLWMLKDFLNHYLRPTGASRLRTGFRHRPKRRRCIQRKKPSKLSAFKPATCAFTLQLSIVWLLYGNRFSCCFDARVVVMVARRRILYFISFLSFCSPSKSTARKEASTKWNAEKIWVACHLLVFSSVSFRPPLPPSYPSVSLCFFLFIIFHPLRSLRKHF